MWRVENKKDSFRSNVDGGPEEANNKETLNNEKLKLKFKRKCDQIWRKKGSTFCPILNHP